ncbi:ribose transport system permease protein [Actinoplanes campanulatus]|uniref:Ribose transport system permease protein n=1 Tax=Actinoplanes campanulatus TaxID=113559 RepID=A0A7W5AGV4_9ACTN|nr:ABC transporter permease [Actinoplanes campanulatus]MBB3095811.1 ribose transport system permease protein [Actinoplanes campanulatus]GGN11751.1 ABC transporter permease [Actinoplanes campanulatus]GID37094.1 ABC transporter permease [Actinoplanes campanulatus]
MSIPVALQPATVSAKARPARRLTGFMPIIALAVLVAALTVADPGFLTQRSLTAASRTAAPLIVLAAGATLVVLCGGIDLSIAALASLSTVLLALWLPDLGGLATPVVVLVATVIGAVQGTAHVLLRIPSFIVTLGGLSILSAVALVVSGAGTVRVVDDSAVKWLDLYVGGYVPMSFAVAVVVVALIALVLRVTPLHSWISATGYSESAARLAGTPVDLVKVGAFCVSGACAGLAAVMLVSRQFSGGPTMADNLLLPAVAAIVVGGTAITGGHGSVWRSLAGALVVTLLRVGLPIVGVPSAYEQILYGVIIVVAVALTLDRSRVSIIK